MVGDMKSTLTTNRYLDQLEAAMIESARVGLTTEYNVLTYTLHNILKKISLY